MLEMVEKVDKGKYRVRRRVGGKRQSYTFTNLSDAEAKEAELVRTKQQIRSGMQVPKESQLLVDYAGRWLRKREKSHPKSTWAMDESRLRLYILPRLGIYPLPAITSAQIRELLDDAQEEPWKFDPKYKPAWGALQNATRNRIRACLHSLFQDAFEEERVILNPVSRVPKLEEKRKVTPPLTEAESNRLDAAALKRGPTARLLIGLMVFEGRRVSEAVAVQNQDFNLERNELTVSRLCEQESGEIKERIKGRDEGITLPLFPRVRDAYLEHRKASPFTKPTDFCIHDESGKHLSTYQARDLVRALAAEAKVRAITPHVLRATFATLAEEAGYSKEDIQRMLGHSTSLVTEKYIRRSAAALIEKGERLGFGALPGKKGGKDE